MCVQIALRIINRWSDRTSTCYYNVQILPLLYKTIYFLLFIRGKVFLNSDIQQNGTYLFKRNAITVSYLQNSKISLWFNCFIYIKDYFFSNLADLYPFGISFGINITRYSTSQWLWTKYGSVFSFDFYLFKNNANCGTFPWFTNDNIATCTFRTGTYPL